MSKKIFIFRGPPASGKGTITEKFIENIAPPVAFLELDVFRWRFHQNNRPISEVSDQEHRFAYENYLSVLENYLENDDYTIVTEGLFSWDTDGSHGCMQDILHLADRYGFKSCPILMHAKRSILWQRNQAREYSVPKEEFDELYDYVMNQRSDEEIAIDTGDLSVQEAVQQLSEYI